MHVSRIQVSCKRVTSIRMDARETETNEVVDCGVQYVPGVEVTCDVAHAQHVAQVDGVDSVVQQEQVRQVVQAMRPR